MLKWLPFISHSWNANWSAGETPFEYEAKIKLEQHLLFFGKKIPGTVVNVEISQIGPAVVYLKLSSSMGHFIVVETVTPITPLFQKVQHSIYTSKSILSKIASNFVLTFFANQFSRDIVVWNNKTYQRTPILVKNDGNIAGFRRWYSQFYPKNDGSLSSVKESKLIW